MNPSSYAAAAVPCPAAHLHPLRRNPQRITITVSFATYQALLQRSDEQGRSLSNLAAYLLERSIA